MAFKIKDGVRIGTVDVFNNSGTLLVNAPTATKVNNALSTGSGLTGGPFDGSAAITIQHADTSTAANLTASGRTYVTGLTFDTYGHVTGYTTGTETVTDTDTLQSVADNTDATEKFIHFVTNATGGQTAGSSTKLKYIPSTGKLIIGNELYSADTTVALLNTSTTTINLGGASTAINIGASTGTTTVKNNLSVTGTTTTGRTYINTTSQVTTLELSETSSEINVAKNILQLKHTSDQTVSAGFGVGIEFFGENPAGGSAIYGAVQGVWEGTTTNPSGGALVFLTDGFSGGNTERSRITSTGDFLIGTQSSNGTDKLQVSGSITGTVLKSSIATGTAPLTVASTTLVTNLNADLLDGQQGSYYLDWTNVTNKPDPVITVTLTGDVTGTANTTLTDLASGTISVTTTIAANSVALGTDTTGNYIESITGTANQITVTGSGTETAAVTLSLPQDIATTSNVAFNNLTLAGNLTVNGTTTTVNSTVTTLDDPVITLGGDTAPTSDDSKDRGVEFRWHNGTAAKVGFFGFDDSTGKFTFIPDATNTSEVFSGTKGEIDANIAWSNVTGSTTVGSNLVTLTNPGAITFLRVNADNTVSALDAETFRTAIGAGSSSTMGTVTSIALAVPTGLTVSGSPITTSGTITVGLASGYSIPTTASQTNWDSAYSERRQWDGGSTNLVAATGRTSLGATTVGGNLFTLTNPSAITFLRVNADNTVSALDAATFRTAIGAGTSSTTGTVTSIATNNGITGGTITTSGTIGLTGQALALHNLATNGIIVRTAADTVAARTLTAGTNITITNGDGVAGNPVINASFSETDTLATVTARGNKTSTAIVLQESTTDISEHQAFTETVASVSLTAIDSWSTSAYRSAKYLVQVSQGTNYQVSEIMVIFSGTTTYMTEYAVLETNGVLATFTTDVSGGNVRLLVTMGSAASATVKLDRTLVTI